MDDQYTQGLKLRMQKCVAFTKNDLGTIRTGRATPALIEHIEIAAYGGSQRLKLRELATITTSDAQTITIHPFDPSTKDYIVKGIQEANTGLNPISDGEVIRVVIPSLSQDRRQEYLKLAKVKLEAGRIMIRQVRHDEMAKLKRSFESKETTEDEKKRLEKQIQDETDRHITELETIGHAKEQELMQI